MQKKVLKKVICLTASLSLLLVLSSASTLAAPVKKGWPKAVTIASAGVGTSVFAIATGVATLITQHVGVKGVAESGQIGRSAILLHRGDIEFGIPSAEICYDAARGLGQYKQYGKMKVRLLFSGSTPPSVFITKVDSGIRTVKDLKGKTVMATRPNQQSFTTCADIILKSEGMTRKNLRDIAFSSTKESAHALLEGRIDSYIALLPSKGMSAKIEELNMRIPIRFISGEGEKMETAISEVGYAKKAIVYAKYYGKIVDNKDLVSVGIPHQFACRQDLPQDFVYEVMKVIFENLDTLYTFHPEAGPFTDYPLALAAVAYHPGAVKFYKEKGLWTPGLERTQQKLLKEAGLTR